MTIRYDPAKTLKRAATKKKIEALVSDRLTVNRTALRTIAAENSGVLPKKALEEVAAKVAAEYRDKVETLRDEGLSKADATAEVAANKAKLVQRVENAMLYGMSLAIAEKYHGEKYTWLKTKAKNPDEDHRKKWGKVYTVGRGEMPGQRYGCQCGMLIHVSGTTLDV